MKRIDLHTHTVSTISDYEFDFDLDKVIEYVDRLQIDALAITNHNVFNLHQYYEIAGAISIPVFPGIEIDVEGGHLLLISDTDEFVIADFDERAKQVTALIKTNTDSLTFEQLRKIYPDLSKYIVIPHYDKSPIIKKETIEKLGVHVTAGEVASIAKFRRLHKNPKDLVPVLFSDLRFQAAMKDFPTRQTFIDLKEISFAGIKSCLADRTKVALSRDSGNDFFQATDDGLMLSTGLNIILGERSTGKTITLNKIAASSGNAKYIEQFSLLQNDEEKFNHANNSRLSLIGSNYLNEFRAVIEDFIQVDIAQQNHKIETYLESLKKFATENETKDLFSKCTLFSETTFANADISNLGKLIEAVGVLIENKEYEDLISKYITSDTLLSLIRELLDKAITANTEKFQREWLNTIINDIKRDLRIRTTTSFIEDIDLFEIAINETKLSKFREVVSALKTEREIHRENIGRFAIVMSTHKITSASDLKAIARNNKAYSPAFRMYDTPYEYLMRLREIGVEDALLYKFFIRIECETFNSDGFKVSGGERSEFNLIHEIYDATKFDLLLIDEPESSFDNLFLNKEINTTIKEISKLMPVVVVTHNNTVGASIKPNYVAITKKFIEDRTIVYKIYSGYPSDKELVSSDGTRLNNYEAMLNCLEAGVEAYVERNALAYEILKD